MFASYLLNKFILLGLFQFVLKFKYVLTKCYLKLEYTEHNYLNYITKLIKFCYITLRHVNYR